MMEVIVKLKKSRTIPQPLAKPWEWEIYVDSLRAADNRPYAVILTQHNEFEFCTFYDIEAIEVK